MVSAVRTRDRVATISAGMHAGARPVVGVDDARRLEGIAVRAVRCRPRVDELCLEGAALEPLDRRAQEAAHVGREGERRRTETVGAGARLEIDVRPRLAAHRDGVVERGISFSRSQGPGGRRPRGCADEPLTQRRTPSCRDTAGAGSGRSPVGATTRPRAPPASRRTPRGRSSRALAARRHPRGSRAGARRPAGAGSTDDRGVEQLECPTARRLGGRSRHAFVEEILRNRHKDRTRTTCPQVTQDLVERIRHGVAVASSVAHSPTGRTSRPDRPPGRPRVPGTVGPPGPQFATIGVWNSGVRYRCRSPCSPRRRPGFRRPRPVGPSTGRTPRP